MTSDTGTDASGKKPRLTVAVLALLALWPVCIGVAVGGFTAQWRHPPEIGEVILGNTLLLPFALPKAFGDIIGVTQRNSTRGVLPMMVVFWPAVLCLAVVVLRSRFRWVAYALLATLLLLASRHWLIVSVGMMGI